MLPAFDARLRVRERQHPKLYWVDSGIVRAAKKQLGPVAAEECGPLLEGWILTVLRAHNAGSEMFEEISRRFRTGRRRRLARLRSISCCGAVESIWRSRLIKAQSMFSTPQLAGLRAIAELPRLVRRVLVYLGDRRLKTEDGIEVWPLEALLTAVAGDTLWP